jgi:hypothetical protein
MLPSITSMTSKSWATSAALSVFLHAAALAGLYYFTEDRKPAEEVMIVELKSGDEIEGRRGTNHVGNALGIPTGDLNGAAYGTGKRQITKRKTGVKGDTEKINEGRTKSEAPRTGIRSLGMRNLAPRKHDILPGKSDITLDGKILDTKLPEKEYGLIAEVTQDKYARVVRYKGGGKVIQNISGEAEIPDEQGDFTPVLGDMNGILGGMPGTLDGIAGKSMLKGSGRKICNFYKTYPVPDKRSLYIIMDTSLSVSSKLTHTQICAAGAAKSALERGHKVAVINFAGTQTYQPPTDNLELLYKIIKMNKKEKVTRLPSLENIVADPTEKRDFLLISDLLTTINDHKDWQKHGHIVTLNPENRAFLYFFNDKESDFLYEHPQGIYRYLEEIGYRIKEVGKLNVRHYCVNNKNCAPLHED